VADFLVDTSVLIDALNGKRGRNEALRDLVRQGHMLASCAVTVAEVYAGMHPSEAQATGGLLSRLRYCETPPEAARIAGRLQYDWRRKGHTLSLADSLIAATALHHGLILITDNAKHFPMPQLPMHTFPGRSQ
jgi:predicted nucleic acid-binding protein